MRLALKLKKILVILDIYNESTIYSGGSINKHIFLGETRLATVINDYQNILENSSGGNKMKKSTKVCIFNFLMMILNIIITMISDYYIGGNATNGKIENGICYVKNSNGLYKEVSKFNYFFSYGISLLTVIFAVLGIISWIIIIIKIDNSSYKKGLK